MAGAQAPDDNRGMGALSIGFVGLGNMGWPMAANLAAAGFSLVVRDVDAGKPAGFAAAHPGTVAAAAPADFAVADVVVTMLPDGAIVADAILGWGIGAVLRPGALIIEMSSADPADTLRLAAALEAGGVRVVDAPVSGGVPRAQTGELSIMVGGADEDVAMAQPVLRVLGDPERQFRTGRLGSGHAMKALNNIVGAATYCATAEAVLAGARFGIDPRVMIEILNSSTGRNTATEQKFPAHVLPRTFNSGFALALMTKDLRIALELAREVGTPAELLAGVTDLYGQALERLGPSADNTDVVRHLESQAAPSGGGPPDP
jgi:3-hydroxyisobutyrate dehydrogenase